MMMQQLFRLEMTWVSSNKRGGCGQCLLSEGIDGLVPVLVMLFDIVLGLHIEVNVDVTQEGACFTRKVRGKCCKGSVAW